MRSRMTESIEININIYIKNLPKIYARNLHRHLHKIINNKNKNKNKKASVNMCIDM